MKKSIILIIITFSVICISCEDFLDRSNPNEMTTDDFWKTEEDLMNGLNASYRPLRFNGVYSRWLHILYISRSDEGYSLSPNPTFTSYSNFQTRNDDSSEGVFFTWLDLYKGIFWANQVLDNAPDIEMNPDLRSRIMEEARFIRGTHYFNLAGVFGRGPLMLTALAGEKGIIVEQDGLYEQARKDFDAASKGGLPAYYDDSKDVGRATKGAALGMLVKVYAQQRNWTEVERICREEIFTLKNASGQPLYRLVDYKDNFTSDNENNAESLFEVQFAYGEEAGVSLGCQRPKFLGLPITDVAWDDATASMVVKTDLEKERTINNQPDPRLKATLFYYDSSNPSETFYGKTWSQTGLGSSKVYWKKYTNYDRQTIETYNSGINFRVVRLADIYLLYAEALNELNRTSEAYPYINYVRNRSNLPDLENSTVFTGIGNDQAKMRQQIRHERSCELAGEAWRWLDLERWKCFESEEEISWLKSRDTEFNNFKIGISNRFPIPYREIPLVEGLEQNPGY